jgi:hypothetical protein
VLPDSTARHWGRDIGWSSHDPHYVQQELIKMPTKRTPAAKNPKIPKKSKNRYRVRPVKPPAGMEHIAAPDSKRACANAVSAVERQLRQECSERKFAIPSDRPCESGAGATTPVDLVVVIDTSGSMGDEATDLSLAAQAAIDAARQNCPSDLRVAWFGIERTWTGTNFSQTYRDYLTGLGVAPGDIVGTPTDLEDGAAAILDLSDHYDWRPGARRAIFYLGDEALEGGDPQNAGDVAAADAAIAVAGAASVTVFTYAGTGVLPASAAEYARVATSTGGQAFGHPIANVGGFAAVLEKIICLAGGSACRAAALPDVKPCFHLRWGDGPNDQLETDDIEVLCITACNPYSNVTIRDLTVVLTAMSTDTGDPVPNNPDGTPSVQVKPDRMICFGDIAPCDPKKPDEPSCVSREVVLINRGAREGGYVWRLGSCYSVEFALHVIDGFKLELVES